MIALSKEQIIGLHEQLVRETGGAVGIRDEGMLESAIAAPLAGFDGLEFYPTIEQKAARLGYGLTANHPFVDGNKRIGAHAMLVLLALNGIWLEYGQDELVAAFISVADGKMQPEELTEWVLSHRSS